MNITIIKNKKPDLPVCVMKCDNGLHDKLNKYELTKFLNQHSTTLYIGKPRSGKTSLLYSFMKGLLKKVFHSVYIFQPAESRASMSDKLFDKLPQDQLFNELNFDSLAEVMARIKLDAAEGYNSLIIFDDMTAYLKNNDTMKLFKELVFNRRHLRTSLYFCVQTYFSVPKELRRVWTNLFIFKTSKDELKNIWDELIEYDEKLLPKVRSIVYNKPYQYLFLNTDTQRIFHNFDELVIKGDDDNI